jgi:hypothetical protein
MSKGINFLWKLMFSSQIQLKKVQSLIHTKTSVVKKLNNKKPKRKAIIVKLKGVKPIEQIETGKNSL